MNFLIIARTQALFYLLLFLFEQSVVCFPTHRLTFTKIKKNYNNEITTF